MSSLTDRTDDIRITDAPVTFEMDKEWEKQWHEFEYFIERMHSYLCYAIPVEAVNYDDFQDIVAEAIKEGSSEWCNSPCLHGPFSPN